MLPDCLFFDNGFPVFCAPAGPKRSDAFGLPLCFSAVPIIAPGGTG
jgi:hypothetical protein